MEIRMGPELVSGELTKTVIPLLPLEPSNIHILCIGTDRSTGDSFGPLVGTFLKRKGISNIYGTIHDTVNATNLKQYINKLRNKFVIAIDASLGRLENVRTIIVKDTPIHPGSGVGKNLPGVGNVSISGIINMAGYMEYLILQNTKLSVVWDMAEYVAHELCAALEGSGS